MSRKVIQVWGDRWLPFIQVEHSTSTVSMPVSRNTKVASLINQESGEWDIEFLRPIIPPEEYAAMSAIYPGDLELPNRLIWHLTKTCSYSVK